MIINATRSSTEILHGFTMVPGDNIINNFINFLNNSVMDPLRGLLNSVIIVIPATALMMYFSSLTVLLFTLLDLVILLVRFEGPCWDAQFYYGYAFSKFNFIDLYLVL